ncbi:MAG: hypothetical protein ABR525_08820 [Candidatus Limnocylindria bacterium]
MAARSSWPVWVVGVALVVAIALTGPSASATSDPTVYVGTMSDGATYRIEVPASYNGTLFLYSHGIQGDPNLARVSSDQWTREWLLAQGFAIAGGSYACSDFCYEPKQMYPSQALVLDTFERLVGHPARTIAWGLSAGGAVTADLLEFYPARFAGGLAECTYIAGSIGRANERLDHAFVMQQLLGFGQPLVNIGKGGGQLTRYYNAYIATVDAAQQTAVGRARLALAEAMVDTPDWIDDPLATQPAATDYATRQYNQYLNSRFNGMYHDDGRASYEVRVGTWSDPSQGGDGSVTGGNFSWNTGVDYRAQLDRSASADVVHAMYAAAGLDLDADLDSLGNAPRIGADPGTVTKVEDIDPIFSGNVGGAAVMTMHTQADPYGYPNQDQGYAQAFADAHTSSQLRQLLVHRSGHCQFTAAEQIAAIQVLVDRIDHGSWPSTAAADLNAAADAVGQPYGKLLGGPNGRAVAPAFTDEPIPAFLRNFNTHSVNPYP